MKDSTRMTVVAALALGAVLSSPAAGAPRQSCGETTGIRRLAVLVAYYGNADRPEAARTLDGLEKTMRSTGYRIVRLDNAGPKTIQERLTLDQRTKPCDYTFRTPLVVIHGTGEIRAARGKSLHVLVTHRITSEFPTDLGPLDEVAPSRPKPGAVYRVTRRTETHTVVAALTRGTGDRVQSNLILATEMAAAAHQSFSPEEKAGLSSVTLPESDAIAPLLARLREATDKPEAFDANGDGRVSNQEMFPTIVTHPRTGLAPWERPRPAPVPVPSVKTEGMGFVVGYNSAAAPY